MIISRSWGRMWICTSQLLNRSQKKSFYPTFSSEVSELCHNNLPPSHARPEKWKIKNLHEPSKRYFTYTYNKYFNTAGRRLFKWHHGKAVLLFVMKIQCLHVNCTDSSQFYKFYKIFLLRLCVYFSSRDHCPIWNLIKKYLCGVTR